MKKIAGFFIVSVLLISCNDSNKQLKEQIAYADSAAINYFKGDGGMDTVVAVKIIRDKQTLDQLTNLLTESSIKQRVNCGLNGSIHFFKNNKVIQDIDFRMNTDECSQFTFRINGERAATRLSDEAKKLLAVLLK